MNLSLGECHCGGTEIEEPGPIGTSDQDSPGSICVCVNNPNENINAIW